MNTVQADIIKNLEKILGTEQLKSEFMTAINHELRTPLTISKAGVELMLDGTSGGLTAKQEELLIITKKSLDRLGRVVENLPAFISGHRETLL